MIILLYCIIEQVTVVFNENVAIFLDNAHFSTLNLADIHIIALKSIFGR